MTSSGGSSGSSSGKRDSDFLKELMKPPIRTKIVTNQGKGSSSKLGKEQDEGSGDYTDEIDEFIKKHIEKEEQEKV